MAKKKGIAVHWFRRDLRLADNPSLKAACEYEKVIPLFIWDESKIWGQSLGAASKWWLHQSLISLDDQLKKKGSTLVVRHGNPLVVLEQVISDTSAQAVFWNELYEPEVLANDKQITAHLSQKVLVNSYKSYLLLDPRSVLKKDKTPYLVFTPFFNAAMTNFESKNLSSQPDIQSFPAIDLQSMRIESLKLEPKINWTQGMHQMWEPGEAGANKMLCAFNLEKASAYAEDRNIPSSIGTSRLSPHLHFGEISPRIIINHLSSLSIKLTSAKFVQFTKELFWREFAHYLLFHFPKITQEPLKQQFAKFPWEYDSKLLRLWQKGQTGYPIVDAGMRELWHTGWMHNRVRMIVASFLVKDLMITWQKGAEWFWDTLVDANLANNIQGWQWTSGCGADAAPYFRIFNPGLQSRKFDPDGNYIKKWCPELEKLPSDLVHEPWTVSASVLKNAGVNLGGNYPHPIVDHSSARMRALMAYDRIKRD